MSKKIISVLLVIVLSLGLAACGKTDTKDPEGEKTNEASGTTDNSSQESETSEPVILNFPNHRAGNTNLFGQFFDGQVERFNKAYEGKYKIVTEKIPSAEDYKEKIRLLYMADKPLPPILEPGDLDVEFRDLLISKGEFMDLTPYFDANPELTKRFIPESVEQATNENGEMFALPLARMHVGGIYYNKEIFKEAGIEEFPRTWDDFFVTCDKIKEAGYYPLSLMTGENGWTTTYLAAAYMATLPGGADVLRGTDKVLDYNNDLWIDGFTFVQKVLKEYGSPAALGAPYSVAANEFLYSQTAMIANGPWMVGDFSDTDKAPEGFEEKVGVTTFPGGIAIGTANGYWYVIPEGTPKEQVEGAIEYFKFIYSEEELMAVSTVEGGFAPTAPLNDEYLAKLEPLLAELNNEITEHLTINSGYMHTVTPGSVQTEMGKNLPLLATGEMTPEEFCAALTEAAKKFEDE